MPALLESNAKPLVRALEATGYLSGGQRAHGVQLGEAPRTHPPWRSFEPDGHWEGCSELRVYFKSVSAIPREGEVSAWRREIWNEGRAPLLWIVSPERIDLYNGFRRPQQKGDAVASRLRSFRIIAKELAELNSLAGRISMETGQFWSSAGIIDRTSSVNEQLLADLSRLQADLLEDGLRQDYALALIGRSIFCQYLADRQIVNQHRLSEICGKATLAEALRNSVATERIFDWIRETFNGDMFPQTDNAEPLDSRHLNRVADFLEAVDPDSGQTTLFPYQFDIIPVELISSIYEHFANPAKNIRLSGAERKAAKAKGIHYTRLPLASFVLDEVLDDLTGLETVLDLTCGSGVFLVEALRRLVRLRSHGRPFTRDSVRSTLYGQLYGVDISEAAIRVAAFSLYLAALELDPDPRPLEALRFEPLIGRTLHVADALQIESIPIRRMQGSPAAASRPFDVIVGNPPWTFGGKASTVQLRSKLDGNAALSPRNPSLAFVQRSMAFAGPETRFGLVLSANPFFGVAKTGQNAAMDVVRKLSPVTIVNLANHSDWLFRDVTMPAVAVFGRHRPDPRDRITVVQVPWSPAGRRSHTFEISASDVVRLPCSAWKRQPALLKAAFCGKRRDLVLLDRLAQRFDTLGDQLQRIGSKLRGGMTLGDGSGDASFAHGLPLLGTRDLRPFNLPTDLPRFSKSGAERPRDRDLFRAPVLLVKEFVRRNARLVSAVAERDVVFTNSHYGAALPRPKHSSAALAAGILNSAFASWFILMSSSTFGLWMQRVLSRDVARVPCPDLDDVAGSESGRRVLEIGTDLQHGAPTEDDWQRLDEAVFDLYGLDDADRLVVKDGLFRASWQWHSGKTRSVEPASIEPVMTRYARSFLTVIDAWLAAGPGWRMRGEVLNLAQSDPLRVVRFVLENRRGPSVVEVSDVSGELSDVLHRIEERLNVRIGESVFGSRELSVYGRDEVVMIKPAARRHWLSVSALEDADKTVEESIAGVRA